MLTEEREKKIRAQHTKWLTQDCSNGQREDSTTILELLSEIDSLRTYAKHLQTELGDSIEYQQKLKAQLENRNDPNPGATRFCLLCEQYAKENEKLKKAMSNKLEEDSSYCKEFSAVLVLQDENQRLRERINYLKEVLCLYVLGNGNGVLDDGGELGLQALRLGDDEAEK